jgi:hypothetical protein
MSRYGNDVSTFVCDQPWNRARAQVYDRVTILIESQIWRRVSNRAWIEIYALLCGRLQNHLEDSHE